MAQVIDLNERYGRTPRREFTYQPSAPTILFCLIARGIKAVGVGVLAYGSFKSLSLAFATAAAAPVIAKAMAVAVITAPMVWAVGQVMHAVGDHMHQEDKAAQQKAAGIEAEKPCFGRAFRRTFSIV